MQLRILHVGSLYPPGVVGGAEKVAAMVAEGQAARGHTVSAAHLAREAQPVHVRNGVEIYPLASRNLLWIEDVHTRPRAITIANKASQAFNYPAVSDFAKLFQHLRPHVVHTHSMVELPPMVWRAARRSGAAVVHTLHDYDLLCTRATMFKHGVPCERLHPSCAAAKLWKGVFVHDIDALAAVSKPVMEAHLRHGLFAHLPEERRRIVWNGVTRRATSCERRRGGTFTFGFLGRLVPEKGLGVLLHACRSLPAQGWRLRIAGRAPAGLAEFQVLAEGLPVEFVGFQDSGEFLASIDVLAAPSIWAEPFGLTVVEAYAAGVPVIGSNGGAIGELVGSVDPRWVIPANDVAALTARMADILAAGRERLPLPSAFEGVLNAASPGRMIDAYLDLYGEALRHRREAPALQAASRAPLRSDAHAHPAS